MNEFEAALAAAGMAVDDLRAIIHYIKMHPEEVPDRASLMAMVQIAQRLLERLRRATLATTPPKTSA